MCVGTSLACKHWPLLALCVSSSRSHYSVSLGMNACCNAGAGCTVEEHVQVLLSSTQRHAVMLVTVTLTSGREEFDRVLQHEV